MLPLAIDQALKVTLVYSAVWLVIFPAIVTGLIVYAIAQSIGEKRQNDQFRQSRR
jgi:phage shock protein PspC (stress-responsive transcriptional regulator)